MLQVEQADWSTGEGLHARVGLHTGEAADGLIGSPGRLHYRFGHPDHQLQYMITHGFPLTSACVTALILPDCILGDHVAVLKDCLMHVILLWRGRAGENMWNRVHGVRKIT